MTPYEEAAPIARPPKVPSGWVAIDVEVEKARARAVDLAERSRQASEKARSASERVAEVEREDRARRSRVMADGEDDPGADRKSLDAAERAAEKASETASITSDALSEALRRFGGVCDERAEPWQRAATKALDEAGAELREAVSGVEDAYRAWRGATWQLALATEPRTRRKPITIAPESVLDMSGAEPVPVGSILRRIAALTERPSVHVEEPDVETVGRQA